MLMRTTPCDVLEIAHGIVSLCYAETLSLHGDCDDFARVVDALQREESRFPFLRYMYWDGVPEFFCESVLLPEAYPATIAKVPVSSYRLDSRVIELWVRVLVRPDSSAPSRWICIEWDMGRPDLSRISVSDGRALP